MLPLTPKALDTLLVLVENAGRAVGKDELMERVWPGHQRRRSDARAEHLRAAQGARRSAAHRDRPQVRLSLLSCRCASGPRQPRKVILVVLPLENLSGDAEQEYFSDGLTDEMITQLGRLNPERLGVIARTSAMKYKLTEKTVRGDRTRARRLARRRRHRCAAPARRVRVTAQLVQVADQTHLWAESYDRDFDDILVLQSDIAQAIAQRDQDPAVAARGDRLPGAAIGAQAHEAYLEGPLLLEQADRGRAEEGDRALPGGDRARAGLRRGLRRACPTRTSLLACRGVLPARETFQTARRAAASRRSRSTASLGEGYATLAHVRLHDWDWTNLDEHFQRALNSIPPHAFAHYWYAEYLLAMGRV